MAVVAVTTALLATCFQLSYAAVAVMETSASSTTTVGPTLTSPAASTVGAMTIPNAINAGLNPVNYPYNSPYMPVDDYYGVDMLNDFPYRLPCDCSFAHLMDQSLASEIALITNRYNQQSCGVQQWERLISKNMPGIDVVNSVNMLSSLASAVQREQVRRNLVYGNYPEVCLNYVKALDDYGITTVSTTNVATNTVLARREPQAAVATTSATTTVTNSPTLAPWANTPYAYSMQYLFDRALPNLTSDLKLDIITGVMANTPPQFWNMAYPLAQQLTTNIRGAVSDMVDLTVPSVTLTY